MGYTKKLGISVYIKVLIIYLSLNYSSIILSHYLNRLKFYKMRHLIHLRQYRVTNFNINKASFNLKVIYKFQQRVAKRIVKLFKKIDVKKEKKKEKTGLEIFYEKYSKLKNPYQ